MGQGIGHGLDICLANRRRVSEIILSADSAHGGSLTCNLSCQNLLHALRSVLRCLAHGFSQEKTKASKKLRLSPTMHRHIVPPNQKLSSAKRAVRFLPASQCIFYNSSENSIQIRKSAA